MRDRPSDPAEPCPDVLTPEPSPANPRTTRRVTSQQLFGGAVELEIDHLGMRYRLRQTALGKLILTK